MEAPLGVGHRLAAVGQNQPGAGEGCVVFGIKEPVPVGVKEDAPEQDGVPAGKGGDGGGRRRGSWLPGAHRLRAGKGEGQRKRP